MVEKTKSNWLIKLFILLYILFLLFIITNFRIIRVSGISMKPTLDVDDLLLVFKYPKRYIPKPKHGMIVSFKSPSNPNHNYVKRIIGLPEDEIRIEDGRVFLNGAELKEDYIKEDSITSPGYWDSEWTVLEGHVFVLGDNRQAGGSSDSRSFGYIKISDII